MKKLLPLILMSLVSVASAEWRLNPYTQRQDYYEAKAGIAESTGAISVALQAHTVATSTHGATSTNTPSRIVIRDASGDFSANAISVSTLSPNSVDFIPIVAPSYQEGRIYYDSTAKTLVVYSDTPATSLNVGEEMWVVARNNTGSDIPDGKVVYITGSIGTAPTIALAQSNAKATSKLIGVTTMDIAKNTSGKVTVFGKVNNVTTSGLTAGNEIFISPTSAGEVTVSEPAAPNYAVRVGVSLYEHPTAGILFVHPDNSLRLGRGASNQLLGMNTSASEQEYKTLRSTDVSIAHSVNYVDMSVPQLATIAVDTTTIKTQVNSLIIQANAIAVSTGVLTQDLATEVSNRQIADAAIAVSTGANASEIYAIKISTGTLLPKAGGTVSGTITLDTYLGGKIYATTGSGPTNNILQIDSISSGGRIILKDGASAQTISLTGSDGIVQATSFQGDGSALAGLATDAELAAVAVSTGAIDAAKVERSGDTMTGQLTLFGSTLTVTGSSFSVGGSTLVVANGRVGAGTNNPGSTLHVNGDITGGSITGSSMTSTGNMRIGGILGVGIDPVSGYGVNTNLRLASQYGGGYVSIDGESVQQVSSGKDLILATNYGTDKLVFKTGATTRATITDAGHVNVVNGITASTGTFIGSASSSVLQIGRNSATPFFTITDGTNNTLMGIATTANALANGTLANSTVLRGNAIHFSPDNGTSVAATIGAGGNVGIGTTAPPHPLSVVGNIASLASTSDDTMIKIIATPDATYLSNTYSTTGKYTPLHIQTAATTRIFVSSTTGNIGIGLTAPTAKLHIKQSATDDYMLKISSVSDSFVMGVDKYGHIVSSGTSPTLGTCTNGSVGPQSSDRKGTIMFSGANSTCAVVFSKAYNDDNVICMLTPHDGTGTKNGAELSTHGATGFTFTPNLANYGAGDHVHYFCEGNP